MGKSDLDSIFRERFKNHKESIDADDMIARLNLDQDKRKRRSFFFWLFGGFAVLALAIVLMFNYNNEDKITTNLLSDHSNNIEVIERSILPQEEKDTETGNKIEARKAVIKSADMNIDSEKNVSGNGNAIAASLNNAAVLKSKNETRSKSQNIVSENETTLAEPINLKNKLNGNTSVDAQNTARNESILLNGLQGGILLDSSGAVENTDNDQVSKSYASSNRKEGKSLVPSSNIPPLKINRLENVILEEMKGKERTLDLVMSFDSISEKIVVDEFIKVNFLEVYGVGSLVSRNVFSLSSIYDDHVRLRNQNESQLEALQFGVSASRYLNKRFYWSGGIEYTQINERSTFNFTSDTSMVEENIPVLFQIQSSGDTITEFGSKVLTATAYHTLIQYNHHKLFTLPVNFGVYGKLNKLSWFASAGLSLNLYTGFYGTMLDEQNEISSSISYFKPKVGLGYRVNLGLGYPLSDRMDVMMAVKFQDNIGSIADAQVLSQTYKFVGLKVGLRYQLGK